MKHRQRKKGRVLAVIGGGSTYTPELVDGLARREQSLLPLEVRLMDHDREKLSIVTDFCRRMLTHHGSLITIKGCDTLSEALEGATHVVSQIRVGGHEARHRDLELGLRHGLIGQETTGVGGFANALRSIPESLRIAREMRKSAQGAILLNFTNPSGIVTEALTRHARVKVIGLCNIPWLMQEDLARALGVSRADLEVDYVGLNHFTWVYGIRVRGKDRIEDLISRSGRLAKDRYRFPRELIAGLKALPSPYLQYYYETDRMLEMLRTDPSRAKVVMQIEQELLRLYQNPKLHSKPKALMQRGGAYYGEAAAALLAGLAGRKNTVHIVNYPNGARFPWLPRTAVVEVPWKVSGGTLAPIAMRQVPPHLQGMIARMKVYEELTVAAAVTGDRTLAFQALLTNPLVGSASKAAAVLDDLLKTNRRFLPQFR